MCGRPPFSRRRSISHTGERWVRLQTHADDTDVVLFENHDNDDDWEDEEEERRDERNVGHNGSCGNFGIRVVCVCVCVCVLVCTCRVQQNNYTRKRVRTRTLYRKGVVGGVGITATSGMFSAAAQMPAPRHPGRVGQ